LAVGQPGRNVAETPLAKVVHNAAGMPPGKIVRNAAETPAAKRALRAKAAMPLRRHKSLPARSLGKVFTKLESQS
jgi:hypothetical protein